MSADTTPKTSAAKPDTNKSDTKTSSPSSDAPSSGSASSSETTKSKPAADGAATAKSDAPKSARESIGGKSEVHYGYFSNVKTPEFRSGWEGIWGNKKASAAPKTAKRPTNPKAPVSIAFDFDDLPEGLRDQLRDAARAQLGKSRVNYDAREKADAVSWRIECTVRR